MGIPRLLKWSTIPSARGASGPTTISSIRFSDVAFVIASISVAVISRLRAICAVPALPGAAKISLIFLLLDSFQTRACSRAPFPITRTLRVFLPVKLANYLRLRILLKTLGHKI